MKIILSRKGFDSSAGGVASPLLPDGQLCSLPIPEKGAKTSYAFLRGPIPKMGKLVADLTRGRHNGRSKAHVDPDLDADFAQEQTIRRPLFGQHGAAQGHLEARGVGVGDLFLFFGWFRQVERQQGTWRFVKNAPDRHIFYGWMQVDRVISLNEAPQLEAWMHYHPHCHGSYRGKNVLYVARERLSLPGLTTSLPGAGIFPALKPELVLTKPDCSRGIWLLPQWMHPSRCRKPLSYHDKPERWQMEEDRVCLDSAKRGQEFILDVGEDEEPLEWVQELVLAGSHSE